MNTPVPSARTTRSAAYRWADGIVGCLLVAIAVVAFAYFDAASHTLRLVTALGIAALGVDAFIAAFKNRCSLIGRIGPLP